MQQTFRIKRDSAEYGPYTVDEMRNYFHSGLLVASDLALDEATSVWVPVPEILGREISPVPAPPPRDRNVALLVAMAIVWWIVFAICFLITASTFAGALVVFFGVKNPEAAGEVVGRIAGMPIILGSLALSIWLTVIGKLPGTRK